MNDHASVVIVCFGAAWCGVSDISGGTGISVLFQGAAVGVYAWVWMVCLVDVLGTVQHCNARIECVGWVLGMLATGRWVFLPTCININGVDPTQRGGAIHNVAVVVWA